MGSKTEPMRSSNSLVFYGLALFREVGVLFNASICVDAKSCDILIKHSAFVTGRLNSCFCFTFSEICCSHNDRFFSFLSN